ncbi:CaiB/BaiF CoA-transferase family protein [Algiphilus sp. W345]|uniref:CaiB/BaiF CoA-transferase family protein n=1 Tax=Banduia mediterranea TaxID=3075609 RepID=A0ABU2WET9_9GAMM|nr:CaiB/BaiF CoA-transferase family protein [Algiphilus sp. W345]MDT0496382.1 CaiB/BaiF CoA-transferase family protein [Algiphilus sp. W345]
MLPLEGLLVVSLEHAIAAPLATRHLADLGARVIKIERPEGGDFARAYDQRARGLASHFAWCNRSKESLTLDVKHPSAHAALMKLVAKADVLVQNLAPGAAARLGLSYEVLSEHHPRIIVCDISGYGDSGPCLEKKAYDLLIQAESGFLSITGPAEAPAKAGNSIADISAGMYAYSNILAALLERARTGRGRRIDISLLESMTEWMGYPLYFGMDGASPPPRTGAAHATIYPYGPFRTGDGSSVLLGVQNDREWKVFARQVLRRPELADDPRFAGNAKRVAHRAEIDAVAAEAFAGIGGAELIRRLDEAGIANGRINDVHDVWAHPQLAARGRWASVAIPGGDLPALIPPGRRDTGDVRLDPVPALGEHSRAILAELGYGEAESAALAAAHATSFASPQS